MDRRHFLRTSSGATAAAVFGGLRIGCGEAADASRAVDVSRVRGAGALPWRLAICNEILQELDWTEQCRLARSIGYRGLEVAPFTLADHVSEVTKDRREDLRAVAEAEGLEILGLHWLLVTPRDLHVTTANAKVRARSWAYVVELAELCADLGGEIMVFGSPNQRSSHGTSTEQAVVNLTEGLREVAPAIGELGVKLLLEPLSSDQTDVIITLDQAVAVVEDVDHPAISTMFDYHNTADETDPLPDLIRRHFDRIEHVHIHEMDGTYLGTGDGEEAFLPALATFRDLGYSGWISLEVFDFEPGAETIAAESMDTLRRMEAALD